MELTEEERKILEHVLLDVDKWVSHALSVEKCGERAVREKIERYRKAYLKEKDKPDYKNRKDRESLILE